MYLAHSRGVAMNLQWYLDNGEAISNLYRADDGLRREPDPVGLYNWLYHMREESWTLDQVKASIYSSPEWHAIHDFPNPPSRERVCGVKLSFQGLTVQTQQFGTVNWFEPWLQALNNPDDRQAVYAAKRAAGDTHCIVEFLKGGPIYNEPPFDRFVSPNYEASPAAFRTLVEEVIQAGFTPLVVF